MSSVLNLPSIWSIQRFRLWSDEGQFLVRVHREEDYTLRLVESELAWLQALSQEANVTVQTPRLTPDGRGVVLGEARGVPKAYPITMLFFPGSQGGSCLRGAGRLVITKPLGVW